MEAVSQQTKRDCFGFKRNPIPFYSIGDLRDALIRAETAHTEFERGPGSPDHNRPLWYASYMAMEQRLDSDEHMGGENSDATSPLPSPPEVNRGPSNGLESDQEYLEVHK